MESVVYRRDTELLELRKIEDAWNSFDKISVSRLVEESAQHKNKEGESCLKQYLQDNTKNLEMLPYEMELIMHLIDDLLHYKGNTNELYPIEKFHSEFSNPDVLKSFAFPKNTHKYFSYQLFENDLSFEEFNKFRFGDFNLYYNQALEWFKSEKKSALLDRLDKIRIFVSRIDFENHLNLLISLGYYQIENERVSVDYISYSKIVEVIKFPYKRNEEILLFSTKEDYKEFLLKVFDSKKEVPYIESRLIYHLFPLFEFDLFTEEELIDIEIGYLKTYCSRNKKVNQKLFFLHDSIIPVFQIFGTTYRKDEEFEIFSNFYKKYIKDSQLGDFIEQTAIGSNSYKLKTVWINKLFKNIDGFREFLNENTSFNQKSKYIEELNKFIDLSLISKNRVVEFNFEHLKPGKWIVLY